MQNGEPIGGTVPIVDWPGHAAALPGPVTLTAIRDTDPARMSPSELVDAINCSERLMSHLTGLQTRLLTEFARPGRSGDITRIVEAFTDFDGPARHTDGGLDTDLLHTLVNDHAHGMAAAEVAAALHISPITARHRVDKAIDLHDGLPATHQALTAGRIDRGRAAMIAEHTAILDDPQLRAAVEEKILPLAETRTAGRLRPLVDRAVIIADPDAAERRVKKARRGREVTHQPGKDDMSIIRAALPADGAVTVYTLIDLIAASSKTPGDDRGIGERRADALTDIADQLLTNGHIDLRGLLHNPDEEADDDDWSDGGFHHTNPDRTDPDDIYDDADRANAWQLIEDWDASNSDAEGRQAAEPPANCTADDQPPSSEESPDTGQQPTPESAPRASDSATGNASVRNTGAGDSGAENPTDGTATSDLVANTSAVDTERENTPAKSAADGIAVTTATPAESAADGIAVAATLADSTVDLATAIPIETPGEQTDVDPAGPTSQTLVGNRSAVPPTPSVPASPSTVEHSPSPRSTAGAPAPAPSKRDSNRLLSRQGRRPHLTLTMSLSTLMALDRLPGHLDGYGAVTAELAHAIAAAAASLSLVIIDPETGSPLHAGERHVYRPRQRQRDVTTTLFDTCRFPSCRQPSWRCDLDHRQPFDHRQPDIGGHTCDDNLDPYCRRHHLLKHHSDWTPQRQVDGTLEWSSPTRHSYIDQPRELTLPGELTHPEPDPRTGIGLADPEHHERCSGSAERPEPDEPTSTGYRVQQAINREHHQRVRDRFSYLKKVIALPPRPRNDSTSARFSTFTIESRAAMLRSEFEADRAARVLSASTLHDEDIPPF